MTTKLIAINKTLTAEGILEVANKIRNMKTAMQELVEMWELYEGMDELLTNNYPFDESLDELVFKVSEWCESVQESI